MNVQRVRTGLRHARRLPELLTCLSSISGGGRIAASYAGLTELRFPAEVRFRSGVAYRLEEYYDLETLWQIHFHHIYRLTRADEVIVDAGANVGLFTCWAAWSNPRARIVAVEPSQKNFVRLVEHIAQNGIAGRVTPLQVALSASSGTAWLSETASASQMLHLMAESGPGAVAVEALSLADLLARLPYEHIDFLKMDIEGSEYGVLMSTDADELDRIGRITVEYHASSTPDCEDKRGLIEHLRACGFRSVVDRSPLSNYGLIDATRE